ncbi:unnamed protein product [Eruca vesicaria subsp. sativa]|uniref:Uncharacterized protein n=1 Tax=Eruca vesicaria subsp. sativa TaxID=29727 RepID=A0ABC8J8B0_ERUVS|nr:unnamed protein product [Eruca vesicaria subsp. sativa]
MQANDDHLIEFSEALRTVAKALRGSSEGKALAQAETAEWKRIYELERSKNLQLLHKAWELQQERYLSKPSDQGLRVYWPLDFTKREEIKGFYKNLEIESVIITKI